MTVTVPSLPPSPAPAISSFIGSFRFLSNFYPAIIYLDGVGYPTVEHAYQAAKTEVHAEREKVRLAQTAGKAKSLGRRVTMSPLFDVPEVKLKVMLNLIRQKFGPEHPELRRALLATHPAELVESNDWDDFYWGVCHGVGENHLGLILMKVREEIRLNVEVP